MIPADPVEVLVIVKLRLPLVIDNSLDALINSYIKELGRRIQHYCNILEVPEELTEVWAAMTIDAMRIEQAGVPGITPGTIDGMAIKIGDTSVTPVKSGGASSVNIEAINKIILNYLADLNHYRKLRW